MDERTLTALKESIAKWERNAKAESVDDMTLGWRQCPLCLFFFGSGCRGCPVRERTGFGYCMNTPYENFDPFEHDDDDQGHIARGFARQEVEFLKSLLPEGEGA